MTKEEAKQKITELVEKYQKLSEKNIKELNEAATKQGFIEPMFRALGWNFEDTNEVSPEENASNGRVDYAFKLNGVSQFYIEAKPLKADLNNPDYIKQAITYAYNNGVTWAGLTNFGEIRIFNAQKNDAWINLKSDDYSTYFDRMWLLSKEYFSCGLTNKQAVMEGALAASAPIEERLFKQLRTWREELFNQLFHYNDWLKPEQRDEVIEKFFNRLIFIRTAEDRKLEEHQLLSAIHIWQKNGHKKDELRAFLRQIFQYYNGYYDSELFKTHSLDNEKLLIDEYIISDIINGLYDIPGGMAAYDFSIIDADVLGRVYEQYLGYIAKAEINKAQNAQAKMSLGFAADYDFTLLEKKQHRKEQGIYYTPKFITDYIVKETVGRFIKENQADGYNNILNIKILDPACGSGSFLIRAYDELLNYHATVHGKAAVELPQEDRMPILTRNIYGVDLDEQAVEIARLNLLLRGLAKRDHLPPLTDNIKRGNSLISGGEDALTGYFGKGWMQMHPFNWDVEFKDVMANGGFDVVIGNPPYFSVDTFGKASPVAAYLQQVQPKIWMDKTDILFFFLGRAIQLTRKYVGFIISRSFLEGDKASKLRKYILDECYIKCVIDFRDFMVFKPSANIATCLLVLEKRDKSKTQSMNHIIVLRVKQWDKSIEQLMLLINKYTAQQLLPYEDENIQGFMIDQNELFETAWNFSPGGASSIYSKIDDGHPKLGEIAIVGSGMQTACNEAFTLTEYEAQTSNLEKHLLKKRALNSDIDRYVINHSGKYLIYVEDLESIDGCPQAAKYLETNKNKLESRAAYKRGDCEWYKYSFPMHKELYDKPKIIIPYRASQNRFALDENAEYLSLTDTTIIFPREDKTPNLKYLLGILNSKLMTFRYKNIGKLTSKGIYEYFENGVSKLPIRQINFSVPTEKSTHDKLVALVENIIELNKRLALIQEEYSNERDEVVGKIKNADAEIDKLVYELYDLTAEEIAVVEENNERTG